MRKCDSCGKVVVNEKDYMCPHCGAMIQKHCDHSTHLPDDKYNRANDYRTASAEHKSKTYDYEKAPKTDNNQKFDINDLANIKNAEDAKKIVKKAFIEQDANGKKKFKPVAIALIVILALNIFGNLLGVLGEVVDSTFDSFDSVIEDIASELPDEWVGYELGEETLTHNLSAETFFKGASYDVENDCLIFNLSEILFKYKYTKNEDYDTVTEKWQSEFTLPQECFYSERIEFKVTFFSQEDIKDEEKLDNSWENNVSLYGEVTSDGAICIYGLAQHIKEFDGQPVFLNINDIILKTESVATKEKFEYWFNYPFSFVKLNPNGSIELFDIYAYNGEITTTKIDLNDQCYPDIEELEEYVDFIAFSNVTVDESVPASATYTEMVTLVD